MVVKKIVARAIKHIAKKSPIVKKSSRIRRKKHTPKYQDKKYSKKQLPTKAQAEKIRKATKSLVSRQQGIDGANIIFGFGSIVSPPKNYWGAKVTRVTPLTKKEVLKKKHDKRMEILRMKQEMNKKKETHERFEKAGNEFFMTGQRDKAITTAEHKLLDRTIAKKKKKYEMVTVYRRDEDTGKLSQYGEVMRKTSFLNIFKIPSFDKSAKISKIEKELLKRKYLEFGKSYRVKKGLSRKRDFKDKTDYE